MTKKGGDKLKSINLWIIVLVGLTIGALILNYPNFLMKNNDKFGTPNTMLKPTQPSPLPAPKLSAIPGGQVEYRYDLFGFKIAYPESKHNLTTEGFMFDKKNNTYYPVIVIKSRGESLCSLSQCDDFQIEIIIKDSDHYGSFEQFHPEEYKNYIVINNVKGFKTDTFLDPITNTFSIKLPKDSNSFYNITAVYQDKYQKTVDQIINSFELLK